MRESVQLKAFDADKRMIMAVLVTSIRSLARFGLKLFVTVLALLLGNQHWNWDCVMQLLWVRKKYIH